ncbi:unnamed protein product [Cylicocyclus nassatus]|uniref:Uncharacterized protein n=1 Tax=Cylicocyclus nassatus TaxID=53992 RepID=A0AA36MGL6_CYLNA|nr:unnamed protein product [Cylicocyclus nassatus]
MSPKRGSRADNCNKCTLDNKSLASHLPDVALRSWSRERLYVSNIGDFCVHCPVKPQKRIDFDIFTPRERLQDQRNGYAQISQGGWITADKSELEQESNASRSAGHENEIRDTHARLCY